MRRINDIKQKVIPYLTGSARTNFNELKPCPRCNHNYLPMGYLGAISRYDNKTEICSSCGVLEAFEEIAFIIEGEGDR